MQAYSVRVYGGACIVCCLCTVVRNVYGMFNTEYACTRVHSYNIYSAVTLKQYWSTPSIIFEPEVGDKLLHLQLTAVN